VARYETSANAAAGCRSATASRRASSIAGTAGRAASPARSAASTPPRRAEVLAGLELPTEGEVAVLGERGSALSREARAAFRAANVALVEQEPRLLRS
jgi:hypothetical protein